MGESMRDKLRSISSTPGTPGVPRAAANAVSSSQPCVHPSIGVTSMSSPRPSVKQQVPQESRYDAVARLDNLSNKIRAEGGRAMLGEEWVSATEAAKADVHSVHKGVAGKAMSRLPALEVTVAHNEG